MTWNFPEDQIGKLEAMAAYLNFLKTEVEQLRKNFPIVPEAVLGTFGGGPTDASVIGDGDGGGEQEKCFAIGKTNTSSDKSPSVSVPVTIWEYSGGSHVPEGTILSVYNLFGTISANKFVALAKDIDTDAWYITAAECG